MAMDIYCSGLDVLAVPFSEVVSHMRPWCCPRGAGLVIHGPLGSPRSALFYALLPFHYK